MLEEILQTHAYPTGASQSPHEATPIPSDINKQFPANRKMKSRVNCFSASLTIAIAVTCFASVSAQDNAVLESTTYALHETFQIENSQTRIKFDPESGTYDIWDKTKGKRPTTNRPIRPTLAGMGFSGNQFKSSDTGYTHQGQATALNDGFGQGRELSITSSSTTGQPTLILKLRIYDQHSFITAGGGMKNTTTLPVQLKTFTPAEGMVFPEVTSFPNLSFLEGNSGANLTRVVHEAPVTSRNNILMTFGTENDTRSLVMGGLTYVDYQKSTTIDRPPGRGSFKAAIQMHDDVGKRIDPGQTYTPEDLVYIDFLTHNAFDAAEQYARSIRDAMNVKINAYTFPSICMWFISVRHFGGDTESINDTPGAVREMDHVVKSGFLKYSPVAVRMVPDNYEANNQQGWWDDAHWQKYGRKERCVVEGGHYKAPYETSTKWCKAITERGGIPTTYFQPGVRSEDYAEAFPGHMIFNEAHRDRLNNKGEPYIERHAIRGGIYKIKHQESYDYTDPGFLKHMRTVYANLAEAGMRGVFYDYPTRAYPGRGGMEDRYSTASAAYRSVYRLAREALGPVCYLQERLGWGSDLATGLVDSQRTEGDTNILNQEVVRRAGLRWYKNRMITNLDMDGKALIAKGSTQEIPISNTERQAILTMNYTISARLLLTESFSKMSPAVIHDLSRTIPYHDSTLTARPLDAFTSEYPTVFDFAISPRWHQLVLYNGEPKSEKQFDIRLSGDTTFGAIGLDPSHSYYLYDFWNDQLVGKLKGSETLRQKLRPDETRMLSIHQVEPNPQWLSTDRHIMQGYVDMTKKPSWNGKTLTLTGTSKLVAGEPCRIVIALNGYKQVKANAKNASSSLSPKSKDANLLELELTSGSGNETNWSITFQRQ